jgi:RHS repeat-associated protein
MTNAAGQLVDEARYLPFGGYRDQGEPTAGLTDHGFTSHKHNDDIGLIYMNARYYLPGIGRFASADIIVPNPADPQSYNRYSYVLNNPLKYIDPSGFDPLDAAWEQAFQDAHGRPPTDEDRRDRLFSLLFPGSGPGGTWTEDDWIFYSMNRKELWEGSRDWPGWVWTGIDSFVLHLGLLAQHYNPGEEAQFVKAVANIWGGVPFGNAYSSAWAVRGGPAISPILLEGPDNWAPEFLESPSDDPAHHWAGFLYAGYFFGSGSGNLMNFARDGLNGFNEPDLLLGYVASNMGSFLYNGDLTMPEIAYAMRLAFQDQFVNRVPGSFPLSNWYWYGPIMEWRAGPYYPYD